MNFFGERTLSMKYLLATVFAALFLAFFSAGCVHFSYEGEAFTPTENVDIYHDAEKIPQKYTVMGKAVAYGNYQDVSRDRLEEKLVAEAEARGADAVLVTALQVVPKGDAVGPAPVLRTMEATGAEHTYTFNQLQKDFDGGYGQTDRNLFNTAPNPPTPAVREYRRIIRAEFLRFMPSEEKKDTSGEE